MKNETKFNFSDNFINTEGMFCARLANNIFSQEQLFDSLSQCLRFPIYFGSNWNALFDCVKDFHWISEYVIVLVHEKLPQLSEYDLKIYLEILTDAVNHWESVNNHKFKVVFSESDQRTVMWLMNSAVGAVG